MKISTTQFGEDLLQILDHVVQGELVEVIHNGQLIRLTPVAPPSKMSRLIKRDTLICDPDELEAGEADRDERFKN